MTYNEFIHRTHLSTHHSNTLSLSHLTTPASTSEWIRNASDDSGTSAFLWTASSENRSFHYWHVREYFTSGVTVPKIRNFRILARPQLLLIKKTPLLFIKLTEKYTHSFL